MKNKPKLIWYSVLVFQEPALPVFEDFDNFDEAYTFFCNVDESKVTSVNLIEHSLVISREFKGVSKDE